MRHSRDYVPLDLEIAQQNSPALASTATGFKSIEQHEAESRQQEANRRKRLKITWGVLGSVFVLLVVLTALTTKPYIINRTSKPSTTTTAGLNTYLHDAGMPAHGVWNEGHNVDNSTGLDFHTLSEPGPDYIPCNGSHLRCDVINRLPVPEADFRNLSRRASSRSGMVAADSSRCSQIGRDVLALQSGNAVDAAVAVALCQGVVNPVASGLGGGAFIMVRLANGSAAFLDARETAPAAATQDMYAGLPSNASLFGGLAVAVPGELQGLAEAHRRWGSLPWSDLVRPAASLARQGFAAHPYLVYVMSGPSNAKRIQSTPGLRDAFMVRGGDGAWRLPHVGELCCKRPHLADTLDKIGSHGPGYLSSPGVLAALAAELAAAGGIITQQDLAAAAPAEREPLRVQLGELELLIPPPPSSGAVVAFALKFLAGYGNTLQSNSSTAGAAAGNATTTQGSSSDALGPNGQHLASFGVNTQRDGGLGLHRLVEAMKHGFAIRTALGDPGPPDQPYPHADAINAALSDLLADDFIEQLRKETSDNGVLPDTQYGGRWNPEGVTPPEEHGTSHFCVVDKDRNAVSITTSVNTAFGSGFVSPSTGILFGNTMDDFAQPNKSSIVTPHPSEANFIAPGKRPLSAMSPIIVTHRTSGRLVAVAGASGGPLIVSATLQTLARLLLEGADVSDAVSFPRVHDQLLPTDDTYYENYTWGYTDHKLPAEIVEYLKSKGQVPTAGGFSLGVSQAIHVTYEDSSSAATAAAPGSSSGSNLGVLVGQSDARKDGAPAGY